MKKDLPIRSLFQVPIFSGTKSELLEFFQIRLEEKKGEKPWIVFTPNPEQIVQASEDSGFLEVLRQGTVNLADGQGLVWALNKGKREKGERLMQKIAGREVFHDLLVLAKEKNYKVFLLGGQNQSGRTVIQKHGGNGWQWDPGAVKIRQETREEKERVLHALQVYQPDLVFVAYGAPWQEKWLWENRKALHQAGVKLAMVVGGSFEYEAGMVPKVPAVMESLHLEWFHRLTTQPWRWKRQLKGLKFFLWIIGEKYV